ncbi:hypothetical protein DKG34_25005 [Streptomyces sp. NWU49]|uniref:hypothetical protein n=1 Tax=Streptomyces sp. NWU49 TaxID=2201153 RepID=UPI000D67F77F|nr:hypothetical protein [Streptomyces sp. NWU49]PWJ05066.1 hypothetical protein DKG34_25005 [Streptomyces sp. NWU49]
MSTRSRGGRKASQPPAGWQPPERLLSEGDGTVVRYLAQSGDAERVFDFGNIRDKDGDLVEIELGIQQWLARAFTRRTSARSGVTRLAGAGTVYTAATLIARYVTTLDPAPVSPSEVTPVHMRGLWEFCGRVRSQRTYLETLRALLRDDQELAEASRAELFAQKLPEYDGRQATLAYTDEEMHAIMTCVRGDVRRARDRIRAGRALLERFRGSELLEGSDDFTLGSLLDHFERTGDLPRYPSGVVTAAAGRWGGVTGIGPRLCLTVPEMTAFALLLTALTTENFGTVAAWPAVHYRPDGGLSAGGVALVEAVKPRRGPDREHMITPVEDLPSSLEDVLKEPDGDLPVFCSPVRVYQLLLDLTAVSRQHGDHTLALSGFNPKGSAAHRWPQGVRASYIGKWAVRHGFPTGEAAPGGPPPVEARRVRQTGIEHNRRPVAQTRRTMNDYYLKRSPDVQRESRAVVGDALRSEVAKARLRRQIPVIAAALVDKARTDLPAAAAEAGLAPETLRRLIDGKSDTAVTGCTDHLAGPDTEPGQPCTASFLACLDCENARALPHQLPVQLAMHDRLAALRPHVDPGLWRVRFAKPLDQLRDILAHYNDADQADARTRLTDQDRQMVDALVDGRMDLR